MLSSVLSSGRYALASPSQPYNHLCNTASSYFYLPIDDEPHQDDPSTPYSYTRSLSWDGSDESSTDHSDDSVTRPASPITPGSRHRRQQEIADILEQKDLYNILGLSRTPAPDKMELRRAYLSRSRACHPECVFDSFILYSVCVDVFTFIHPIASFLIILKQPTHFKKFPSHIMYSPTLPQNVSTTRTLLHMSFLATCPGPLCALRKRCEQSLSVF
jgi:hypothetical protein